MRETQFEIKKKLPHQAEMVISVAARMADITGVNEDQIRRQGRENNINKGHISLVFQKKWCDQWRVSQPMDDPFTLLVPPLTHLSVSPRSSRRSTNGMTDSR
jgi:hypothetical protein